MTRVVQLRTLHAKTEDVEAEGEASHPPEGESGDIDKKVVDCHGFIRELIPSTRGESTWEL
jgi:hypothetical protein